MARLSLLTAGFLLSWMAASPARAATDCPSQAISAPCPAAKSLQVATQAPTPLREPHAVDKTAPAQPGTPAKHAAPSPSVPRPAAAKPKTPQPQIAAKPKPRPEQPQIAAKPKVKSVPVAAKAKRVPKKLARSQKRYPHIVQEAPHRPMREARRDFGYPQERPHSGPLYDNSPGTRVPACDEACQYRDWLNRYAAWYRDFGRYYYGPPPRPTAPSRPAPPPPPLRGEIGPPPAMPLQSYRFDQSERDRLDPWHGYNSHSPGNGY